MRPRDLGGVAFAEAWVEEPVRLEFDGGAGGAAAYGLGRAGLVLRTVEPKSAAARAGLAPGDRIVALDGEPQSSWYILSRAINQRITAALIERPAGSDDALTETFRLTYRRGTDELETELTPEVTKYVDEYKQDRFKYEIGWSTRYDTVEPDPIALPLGRRVGYAARFAFSKTWESLAGLGRLGQRIVEGKLSFFDQIGGPILIGELAARAGRTSAAKFFDMMALLSVNLAVFNLLPIPLLDGGRLALLFAETVKRGPLSLRTPPTHLVRRLRGDRGPDARRVQERHRAQLGSDRRLPAVSRFTLAVDTSTFLQCGALLDGDRVLSAWARAVPREHGTSLLRAIARELGAHDLTPADLDLLVCGAGPGSFTGLRVGLAALKGLSLAAGVPLVGASTLTAIARGLAVPGRPAPVVIVDARKSEVYASGVPDLERPGAPPRPTEAWNPAELARYLARAASERGRLTVATFGVASYPALAALPAPIEVVGEPIARPDPIALAMIGREAFARGGAPALDALEPDYVRASDAERNAKGAPRR